MNEDGSYNAEEFNFLQAYNGESKLLLALPQLAWEDLETTASSETYLDNARNLYNTKGVRGYGLLSFQYKLPTDLSQQVGHISHFYDTLKKELQAGDLQNKFTNFFSVQPRQLSSAKDTFKRLLTELQGRVKFIILETFTRTHEKSCVVEAASSWGPEGLFGDFQPNIRSTLDLAMSIDSAQSTVYVLSFSLLATKFAYVKGTRDDLVGKSCSYATYASFYKYCQRGDGEEERWTTYDDTNFYEFDADPSNVYSFETARSIEDKIRRSSAYLGATRLELGWMAFNLSTSIDNGTCVGEQLRLLKARRVINDIQPKHSSLKRRGDANC
ncbi:uncharacterized protein LOC135401054 [Ornithodoros turicata]|uniref:uncharacterized protein LOC135401054 n=1 Tax=Ornithodoros turicata TaxID=34597 RepID=UPI003138D501